MGIMTVMDVKKFVW